MKTGISLLLVMIFISCSKSELPKSVKKISETAIIISLKNNDYSMVYIGSDASGQWENMKMFKTNDIWSIKLSLSKREIQYKFWINQSYWMNDPLNKKKRKVPEPMQGYNSLIEL